MSLKIDRAGNGYVLHDDYEGTMVAVDREQAKRLFANWIDGGKFDTPFTVGELRTWLKEPTNG